MTYESALTLIPVAFAFALSIWSLYIAVALPLLAMRALRKYLRG